MSYPRQGHKDIIGLRLTAADSPARGGTAARGRRGTHANHVKPSYCHKMCARIVADGLTERDCIAQSAQCTFAQGTLPLRLICFTATAPQKCIICCSNVIPGWWRPLPSLCCMHPDHQLSAPLTGTPGQTSGGGGCSNHTWRYISCTCFSYERECRRRRDLV